MENGLVLGWGESFLLRCFVLLEWWEKPFPLVSGLSCTVDFVPKVSAFQLYSFGEMLTKGSSLAGVRRGAVRRVHWAGLACRPQARRARAHSSGRDNLKCHRR